MSAKKTKIVLSSENFDERAPHILRNFRKSKEFCDVVLACTDSNGKSLKAHKVIISAFSSVLENLVKQTACLTNNYSFILINGISHQDLESIIDYIYLGEVCIDEERVSKFLLVAEELQIEGLTNMRISCQDTDGEQFKEGTANACDSSNINDKTQTLTQNESTPVKDNANLALIKNNGSAKGNKRSQTKKRANYKNATMEEGIANACDSSDIHDKAEILTQNEKTSNKNDENLASVSFNGSANENKQSKEEKLSDVTEDTKQAPAKRMSKRIKRKIYQVDEEILEHVKMIENVCMSGYENSEVHGNFDESLISNIKQDITVPSSKKKKCRFQSDWAIEYPWIQPCISDNHKATCTLCQKDINIKSGKCEIRKHAGSIIHEKNLAEAFGIS